MSSEHEEHPAHAAEDHHEPLDLDPVRTLPSDEEPSPSWLPFVGAGLVLVAATAWAVGRAAPSDGPDGPLAPSAAVTASPGAVSPSANAQAARRPPGRRPRPDATAGARALPDPEKMREARRRLEERRAPKDGSAKTR